MTLRSAAAPRRPRLQLFLASHCMRLLMLGSCPGRTWGAQSFTPERKIEGLAASCPGAGKILMKILVMARKQEGMILFTVQTPPGSQRPDSFPHDRLRPGGASVCSRSTGALSGRSRLLVEASPGRSKWQGFAPRQGSSVSPQLVENISSKQMDILERVCSFLQSTQHCTIDQSI